ncbi:MAG: insulinase family protein, partial [Deltaproteobacteria bacterium]|nr:insulinase family protein [Deltaproteobacteria bacterium]
MMSKLFSFQKFLYAMVIAMVLGFFPSTAAQSGVDESYVLPNGLKVILVPQPNNPVITAMVMIKAGSASENGENEYGLAHLMEHMAFKGTEKRGVGEVSSEVETNGGNINAYTSYDNTVYHLSLPAQSVELGLDILSDIVFHPSYDPNEYALEKEVVVEEIKRSYDNPDQIVWTKFMDQSFPDHPYGHPILGSTETVRQASRDTAFAFHNKYYRPDNSLVIVTGGFDIQQVKAMVDKHFSDLKNPPESLPKPSSDSRQEPKGPIVEVVKNELVTVPKVILGFRCPSGGSSEAPQLDLLSSILSQGRSGRLTENIKTKKALVSDIGSFAFTLIEGGVFVIDLETDVSKAPDAIAAVIEELNGLASTFPTEDELARARALTGKSFLDRQESSSDLAALLGTFQVYFGDYRLRDAY